MMNSVVTSYFKEITVVIIVRLPSEFIPVFDPALPLHCILTDRILREGGRVLPIQRRGYSPQLHLFSLFKTVCGVRSRLYSYYRPFSFADQHHRRRSGSKLHPQLCDEGGILPLLQQGKGHVCSENTRSCVFPSSPLFPAPVCLTTRPSACAGVGRWDGGVRHPADYGQGVHTSRVLLHRRAP